MDTIQAITTRRSVARTVGPAPSRPEIQVLLDAAVLAPTHHLSQPWRFVVLSGDALRELGDALAASASESGRNVEAARRLPDSAPAIIAVIDRAGQDHHVSAADEHYAVGAAMQNLLLAAHDAGLGAMIRTGIHVLSPHVRDHLGVKPDEQLAGFIYVGHLPPDHTSKSPERTPAADLTEWRGDATPTTAHSTVGGERRATRTP